MNSCLPTVMKIWHSIWNRWTPLNLFLTPSLIHYMRSWRCTMLPVVCRSRYWCGRRHGMFLPCRKPCPESSEPMSVILPNILISASSRKSQWSGNPFLLNWQERTRSSSIKWSRKVHEPVSTRMPCNGWWMPVWCIKFIAAQLPACRLQLTMTCLLSRFIWWMWDCSAVWRS